MTRLFNCNRLLQFFHPLHPVAIHIGYEGGRATGEADVEFATHDDAVRAMGRVTSISTCNILRLLNFTFPHRTNATCSIAISSYSSTRRQVEVTDRRTTDTIDARIPDLLSIPSFQMSDNAFLTQLYAFRLCNKS